MGSVMRRILLAALLGAALVGVPAPARAFSGFGAMSAQSSYGSAMTFSVRLDGGAPARLELLLHFADDDGVLVAPVVASGSLASYRFDTGTNYLPPNTPVTYQWRATDGAGRATVSPQGSLRYADDRAGLAWSSATIGQATVHWYGGAEAQARRFGALSSGAAQQAEALLGHALAGPIDIFVYDTQAQFFGALGTGAREWTGAATYPNIRTVLMWLGGGPQAYLDTTVVHEVTHVVFYDATHNPFHEPAHWLNEGFATWSEQQNAIAQRATVQAEAGAGLFAFDALVGQFPTGQRGASLSYAQGATFVDMVIARNGRAAIARLAAAYRGGASDAAALQGATGVPASDLYAAYYRSFGAAQPQPIAPVPLLPSILGGTGGASPAAGAAAPAASPGASAPIAATGHPWYWGALLFTGFLAAAAGTAAAWAYRRRAARRRGGGE